MNGTEYITSKAYDETIKYNRDNPIDYRLMMSAQAIAYMVSSGRLTGTHCMMIRHMSVEQCDTFIQYVYDSNAGAGYVIDNLKPYVYEYLETIACYDEGKLFA